MSAAAPFTGRVAVVVGAGVLGVACARELAAGGADVALVDADEPGADAVAAVTAAGQRSLALAADLVDHRSVERVVERIGAELGEPDLLVVATAPRSDAAVGELTDAQVDEAIDRGAHAPYFALRVLAPAMARRGFGRIVVVTGDEGRRGVAGRSHCAAAAWAAIGLAKSVALEVTDAGVAVNVVCTTAAPHAGDPAVWRRIPVTEAPVASEAVADAVAYLLARPGTELSGSVLDVAAGLSALNSG